MYLSLVAATITIIAIVKISIADSDPDLSGSELVIGISIRSFFCAENCHLKVTKAKNVGAQRLVCFFNVSVSLKAYFKVAVAFFYYMNPTHLGP